MIESPHYVNVSAKYTTPRAFLWAFLGQSLFVLREECMSFVKIAWVWSDPWFERGVCVCSQNVKVNIPPRYTGCWGTLTPVSGRT